MITGLDHVQLAAPRGCEQEARRFYGDVLGLEEVPKPEGVSASGGVWFRCGGQGLHIGVQHPFVPTEKGHPGLDVRDEAALQVLSERLENTGAPVSWDDRLQGVSRLFTKDPWGNRIELRAVSGS